MRIPSLVCVHNTTALGQYNLCQGIVKAKYNACKGNHVNKKRHSQEDDRIQDQRFRVSRETTPNTTWQETLTTTRSLHSYHKKTAKLQDKPGQRLWVHSNVHTTRRRCSWRTTRRTRTRNWNRDSMTWVMLHSLLSEKRSRLLFHSILVAQGKAYDDGLSGQ